MTRILHTNLHFHYYIFEFDTVTASLVRLLLDDRRQRSGPCYKRLGMAKLKLHLVTL